MSQLSIIRFGSAGEIAGVNMPPPPDRPVASQEIASAAPTVRLEASAPTARVHRAARVKQCIAPAFLKATLWQCCFSAFGSWERGRLTVSGFTDMVQR